MATKRTTKRGPVLTALPKRIQRVQAEAEKALQQGYKATLGMLPPGPRKAVRELGNQLDDAATTLRARGRKVLHTVERRGEAVADRVERVVAEAEKRRARALRRLERERAKWLEAVEMGARRVLRTMADRLDVASAHDVAQLSKRVSMLERKLTARTRAA
jgi:polyhydroxyalkanoate synthesis regulator phasin